MKNSFIKVSFLLALSFVLIQCKTDDSALPKKKEVQTEIKEIEESKTHISGDTILTTANEKKTKPVVPPIKPPSPKDPGGGGGCIYPRPIPPEPTPLPDPLPYPTPDPRIDEIVSFPETEPEFPGGIEAMVKFISENIKYPKADREISTQGRVYAAFIVEKDGSITNIEVKRGISPTLDQEAKRVIKLMPKWIPAQDKGKPCRSRCTIPITFKLD